MNERPKFHEIFPGRTTVLVVVHVVDIGQTLESAAALINGGADGCFLIQHDADQELLRRAYRKVRSKHPDLWIGLNFLQKTPARAANLALMPHPGSATRMRDGGAIPPPNGLWTDKPLAVEHFEWETTRRGPCPEGFLDIHDTMNDPLPNALYFAGACFKGQPYPIDPRDEARRVMRRGDVVTTSGPRTGAPPSVEKIRAMRDAIGPDTPFAIASGLDARNVGSFLPYANCFLVATSVTGAWDVTDAAKVREFVDAARG